MQSDNQSFQCQAVFTFKIKMRMAGKGGKQKYGKGTLTIGSESLSFKHHKDPQKIRAQLVIRFGEFSLDRTNIQMYPHPVVQYRDVKEFKAEKSKVLHVYLHEPYAVKPLTGQEFLAMSVKTEAILELKFDNSDSRDNARGQLESKWGPFKRTESEVGGGAISPSYQPVTVTPSVSGDTAGYCSNCGESYTEGQKFCGKCGSTIS
ncbi:MAG: zinc ribbon domain-containing protein [Candidatus Thorarchaeota archaeon]|jgi:hypothetical protein